MTRIVICRHANTFDPGETVTRVGARTDLELSKSGRVQVEVLRKELSSFDFTKAYCSALIRTRQTVDAVLDPEIPIEVLEFLTEIDYGEDENKPESEVVARLGQDAIDLWDSEAIPPQGWSVDPDRIRSDWEKFLDAHRQGDEDILVMTSNGIARFVLNVIETPAVKATRKLRTAAFGLVELTLNENKLIYWDRRTSL